MQLDSQTLVFVMVSLVAVQGLGATIFFLWLAHTVRAREADLVQLSRGAGEKLQQLERNLDRLAVLGEKLPDMAATASEQLQRVATGVDRVDSQIEEGVRSIRGWLATGDRTLEANLLQFQRHTTRMQKIIRHPAVRASAVTKAGLAFLTQLLATPEKPSDARSAGDEEIFI